MGIASMTGFSRVEGEAAGISWAWEIKSVNGRSLDLRLRLPPGFDGVEPQLRGALASRFRRGTLSATLSVDRVRPPTVRINRELLAQLGAALGELRGVIEAAPPRLDGLLGLRGVIEIVDDDEDAATSEARRAAILDGWSAALDRLATARAEEGARLDHLLAGQLAEMTGLVVAAAKTAAAQPEAIRARLEAAIAELAGLVPAMPQERIAQEVALLVTRADIREEIDRLRAHLSQAGDLLRQGEAVGRQLDFLCQELNREANTLCSKSADIALTRIGLALKAAIEQFREQVQNLE
ncbi:MAG TPA: YicC/YloC family endoribonuclease [Stellaceae bacterium]|nr:YicC/YloC family endoribonuclease [Stellaceae bacterium]